MGRTPVVECLPEWHGTNRHLPLGSGQAVGVGETLNACHQAKGLESGKSILQRCVVLGMIVTMVLWAHVRVVTQRIRGHTRWLPVTPPSAQVARGIVCPQQKWLWGAHGRCPGRRSPVLPAATRHLCAGVCLR